MQELIIQNITRTKLWKQKINKEDGCSDAGIDYSEHHKNKAMKAEKK